MEVMLLLQQRPTAEEAEANDTYRWEEEEVVREQGLMNAELDRRGSFPEA